MKNEVEVEVEPLVFVDANDNPGKVEVEGIVRMEPQPNVNPRNPPPTRVVREIPPNQDLAQVMYLEVLDLAKVPNKGCPRPRPTFHEDAELSTVVQRVIRDHRISSVNDLIILLNREVSDNPLSPVSAWNEGRLFDPICYDALEYCWIEMKRLGKIRDTTRDREWQELLLAAKRPRIEMAEFSPSEPPLSEVIQLQSTPKASPHDVVNCELCWKSPSSSI